MKTRLVFLKQDEKKIEKVNTKSKNAVWKVTYECERSVVSTKTAYRKEFSDTLSRISALYETAFSVYIRLSLTRAAEVRLVYQDNKPIGIASIELPNFKPMQKIAFFRP